MGTVADKPEVKSLYARLFRGRVYIYNDVEFRRGVLTGPITPEVKAHLQEHAVDSVTLEGEGEYEVRQKFNFLELTAAEYAAEKAAEAAAGNDRAPNPTDVDRRPARNALRQRVRG